MIQLKINTDELVAEVFGDLGYELSSPKEYTISFMNYLLRCTRDKEWVNGIQMEDIEISDRNAKIVFYLINHLLPIRVDLEVKQDIDYDKKGIRYIVYIINIDIVTEINYITKEFHKAEEFLLHSWEDLTPSVERLDDEIFELSGEYVTSFSEQFIPISTIDDEEEMTNQWSTEEKEKTNFAALALSISNFAMGLDDHFAETSKIFQWFKARNMEASSD